MTVLAEDLQTIFAPLATGGAWYGACTSQSQPSEYIVWMRVSSVANVSLLGPADLQNTRVQVDVYARTIARALEIESALESAMAGCGIVNVPLTSMDVYEPDTRLYRVSKDYSVWARN